MERYFALEMPVVLFARNTLIVSVLGLVPLLFLYIVLTPGFASHLMSSGPALGRFMRQVLTNGLPVVFIVNYVGFFLFAWMNTQRPDGQVRALILLIDLPLRVILFIVLHAVIYMISADWFESFGGSRLTALRVVGPTLARSALFENLSGVYLYATLVSALPLYVHAFSGTNRARALPGRLGPILAAGALFGVFTLLLTLAATMLVQLTAG